MTPTAPSRAPTRTSPITRRTALAAGAAAAGATIVGQPAWAAGDDKDDRKNKDDTKKKGTPFQHGIASGDPLPTSVILWTRVTPTADANPGSGRGPTATVKYEVATDDTFRRVVVRGEVRTGPERDHTVKVDARGLSPATAYFYRFSVGKDTSPVGRTHTAPAAGARTARLRLGVVSCANWQAGYFAAYRLLAERGDLDLVAHLGDYLYEYAPGEYQARDVVVRPHDPPKEMTTLSDYRRRHAQYKTDDDLQRLHALVPFVVTWDDHESANDSYRDGAENHTEGAEGVWPTRRGYSQQAYAEWMPVRYELGGQLFRRFTYGNLASLSMLDLRTYRDRQPENALDPAQGDPGRTITGPAQLSFLLAGLSDTSVQWKLVGNPVMISPVRFPSALDAQRAAAVNELVGSAAAPAQGGVAYNVDQWDGYPVERRKVLDHLKTNRIKDAVFLTGDIHSAWACDIPDDTTTYPVVNNSLATELVCTSLTSDNLDDITRTPPRTTSVAVEEAFKANNPHVKYLDFDSHGYSVLDVTPERVQMDYFVLSERMDKRATSRRNVSWAVAAGSQQVKPAIGGIA